MVSKYDRKQKREKIYMLMTRRDEGGGKEREMMTRTLVLALGFDGWNGEVRRVKPKQKAQKRLDQALTGSLRLTLLIYLHVVSIGPTHRGRKKFRSP